ncbi:hypothetical protein SODG_003621 [Sodalis praecaptivus]
MDDDSAVPETLRTGYRLLKNAGYLPAELQDRKDALQLADLLHTLCEDDPRFAPLDARLRLLEMKLRQSGLSTDFYISITSNNCARVLHEPDAKALAH